MGVTTDHNKNVQLFIRISKIHFMKTLLQTIYKFTAIAMCKRIHCVPLTNLTYFICYFYFLVAECTFIFSLECNSAGLSQWFYRNAKTDIRDMVILKIKPV